MVVTCPKCGHSWHAAISNDLPACPNCVNGKVLGECAVHAEMQRTEHDAVLRAAGIHVEGDGQEHGEILREILGS